MTITLTRKEAQQVLDSLLDTMPFNEIEQRVHQAAIETLRTRLAQPEPEPVAYGFQNTEVTGRNRWLMLREEVPTDDQYDGQLWTPLYTAPPKKEWVGFIGVKDIAQSSLQLVFKTREQANEVKAELEEKNHG